MITVKTNVLRLDHRQKRDARITTHVCLTARAFGADKAILSGDEDTKLMENVRDAVKRWGGNFKVLPSAKEMYEFTKFHRSADKITFPPFGVNFTALAIKL